MLVVLARINERDRLRRDIKELREGQQVLGDVLKIALEELEKLQKKEKNDSDGTSERIGI